MVDDDVYASGYSPSALRREATHIRSWLSAGRDTHVYFNNDSCGYAVRDADPGRKFPMRIRILPAVARQKCVDTMSRTPASQIAAIR